MSRRLLQHGPVEPGIVRRQRQIADKIPHLRPDAVESRRVDQIGGRQPVDRRKIGTNVERRRSDQRIKRIDLFPISKTHQSDRTGAFFSVVSRFEIDRCKIQNHSSSSRISAAIRRISCFHSFTKKSGSTGRALHPCDKIHSFTITDCAAVNETTVLFSSSHSVIC